MTLSELRMRIIQLKAEIEAVKVEGNILTGCWMDSAPGRTGTLGGQTTLYRVRWMVDGRKKCRTLKPHEIASTREAIERGNRLSKLQSKLEQAQLELQQAEERIEQLRAELEQLQGVA